MKTVWEYSSHTEALRLLHTAKNIASGFYRLNNFVILPPGSPKVTNNSVIFPYLPYLSIPRFWNRAARINIASLPSIKIDVPADLLSSTQKLISSPSNLKVSDFSVLQTNWALHETAIISAINQIIPDTKHQIKTLTIWPTTYGTACSFNICDQPPYHICLWVRTDCGLAEIVEAILTSLTRYHVYQNLDGLWSESEMLVDWLMTRSNLAPILKFAGIDITKIGTIKSTRAKQQASLISKSQNYLLKLGAPLIDTHTVKSLDTKSFSAREKQLYDLLVRKSPDIVSFDEIHDALFAARDELYSLYAISKTVQRLRDRLEYSGISGSFIQTKRGQGYFLTN